MRGRHEPDPDGYWKIAVYVILFIVLTAWLGPHLDKL